MLDVRAAARAAMDERAPTGRNDHAGLHRLLVLDGLLRLLMARRDHRRDGGWRGRTGYAHRHAAVGTAHPLTRQLLADGHPLLTRTTP